jgi:hypothetical protein
VRRSGDLGGTDESGRAVLPARNVDSGEGTRMTDVRTAIGKQAGDVVTVRLDERLG